MSDRWGRHQGPAGMYALFKKVRLLEIPIDCQFKLFGSASLYYGSEIWGFWEILRNTVKTVNARLYVVYGELGRISTCQLHESGNDPIFV